jgi:uncharacterized protein YkwD
MEIMTLAVWIDLLIVLVLGFYAWDGLRRGFIAIAIEVFGFLASIFGALLLYSPLGRLFADWFNVSRGFSKAAGFIAAWTLIAFLYTPLARLLYRSIPQRFRKSKANGILGGFAGVVDGAILAAFLASFIVSLPFSSGIKKEIAASAIGGRMVRSAQVWDLAIDNVFGGAIKESLSFVTIRQGSTESVDLKFRTAEFNPDPEAEQRLVDLVNAERVKRGLGALTVDPLIVKVSRAHSADMLTRGYFAHITPEGLSPADRADRLAVRYGIYGENIAFAPDVAIAHDGLMNSPGHRANILTEEFTRIGIGIQDAGVYGLMITQNFAD